MEYGMGNMTEMAECPTCRGRGKVFASYGPTNQITDVWTRCTECDGTGEIEIERPETDAEAMRRKSMYRD